MNGFTLCMTVCNRSKLQPTMYINSVILNKSDVFVTVKMKVKQLRKLMMKI